MEYTLKELHREVENLKSSVENLMEERELKSALAEMESTILSRLADAVRSVRVTVLDESNEETTYHTDIVPSQNEWLECSDGKVRVVASRVFDTWGNVTLRVRPETDEEQTTRRLGHIFFRDDDEV